MEVATDSESEVRALLLKQGKVCIGMKKQALHFGKSKIKKEEIIASFVSIGDMLSAGIPLSGAIKPVIQSFPKESSYVKVLNTIASSVREGKPFSKAMASHHEVFGQEVITMIEAGEASGKLPQTFQAAGEYLRTMSEVKGEMIKKLTYPAVLFSVAIVSLLLNSMVVIPKLMSSPLFKLALKQTEGKQDMSSKMIGVIQQMRIIIPSGLALMALFVFLVILYYKKNRQQCETLLMKIALARQLLFYQSYYVSFLAMSNLMSVGVRLDQALMIAGRANKMVTVRNEFENALAYLKSGESFTKGITSLNSVERTMLDTAQNMERVKANFDLIAKRFYKIYVESIQKIAPKIYMLVIFLVVGIIVLMLLAIMLPYSKMLAGMK